MLVVVASRHDSAARALAERWSAQGRDAALLTAEDLTAPGWRYLPGADCRAGGDAGMAVIGGRGVEAGTVAGVLTRRACVEPWELARIAPTERAYVAAEATAFLLAWLSGLACPVLNRPTPDCLAGPGWSPERWALAAARLGLPVRPVRRRAARRGAPTPAADDPAPVTVTVVGERCFGPVDDGLADGARRLAAAAGAGLLAVRFAGERNGAPFLGADPWPDPSPPAVADAILACLGEGRGAGGEGRKATRAQRRGAEDAEDPHRREGQEIISARALGSLRLCLGPGPSRPSRPSAPAPRPTPHAPRPGGGR